MKDRIYLGYPDSGLDEYIKKLILNQEDISLVKYNSSIDVLQLSNKDSLDYIKEKLEYHSSYNSIELKDKHCIVLNLDFSSLEKQEVYLKYIEDSSIKFYFTCYDISKIFSKALLSRVSIVQADVKCELSSILQSVYKTIEFDFKYNSISQRYIWNSIHIYAKELIKYNDSYLLNKEKMFNVLYQIEAYPEWYICHVVFDILSSLILKNVASHKTKRSLVSKIISQYLKSNLNSLFNLELFIHSTYLAIVSYNQLKHV